MKHLYFLVSLLFSTHFLLAQTPSSCNVPATLSANYTRDVGQLAMKRLYDIQSPDTALIDLPQALLDSIFEGMAAIVNVAGIPEVDSVFNIYCIHNTNGWPGLYGGFIVKVDTNYAWTQAWQNLTTLTGNAPLDLLLTNYQIEIDEFNYWSIGNYAVLNIEATTNVKALMNSLLAINGIESVELNSIIGGGGIIEYDVIGNEKFYDFTLEWQDCFDGCDARKTWKFKVLEDCSVEYLGYEYVCFWGQFGEACDPLPTPLNCNTFTSLKEIKENLFEGSIFPNPSKQYTTLQLEQTLKNGTIRVFNHLGSVVKEISNVSGKSFQFISEDLENGLYFIQVEEDGPKSV
jgi:hypothetical protein